MGFFFFFSQLDNPSDDPFQGTERQGRGGATMGPYQALKEDYKQSGYDMGHLFPVSHAHTQETADATFTLTNVVPQDRCLNEIWWRDLEGKIIKHLDNNLKQRFSEAYVVTGAVPGRSTISNTVNVNVPGYLWTAFCCYNFKTKQGVSKAHIAPNDRSQRVIDWKVADLETFLSGPDGYTQPFSIFQGKCNSDYNQYIYEHD